MSSSKPKVGATYVDVPFDIDDPDTAKAKKAAVEAVKGKAALTGTPDRIIVDGAYYYRFTTKQKD
ncbi:MAG: hypothetical protein H0V67_11180 [Geodermatophilaceae bacterium]|nr:hypothetical protein [Geodermatophilaceae bacterium]